MSIPVIKTSFVAGEVAPALYGRVEVTRFNAGASTMRNMWPSFHGGAYSRAGTGFVAFSGQTGRDFPPRLIPLQFSINQGLELEFGQFYMRVIANGAHVIEPPNGILAVTNSVPAVISLSAPGFVNGDWVFIDSMGGMTQLNGQEFVLRNGGGTVFDLFDVFGNPVDTSTFPAYTGGGQASRVFTLPTVYNEVDLKWMKVTESADVLTICCVNQQTGVEYPPQDLTRISDTNWVFSLAVEPVSVEPPAAVNGAASAGGSIYYQYVVTAVNPADGAESVASPIALINGAVDITATAGQIRIAWTPVAGVVEYNIYKAQPGYNATPPVGSLFGYAGTAFGGEFIDRNIVPDFSQVPPTHEDPFARGRVIAVTSTLGGAAYTNATATVVSATGADAVLDCVIVGGSVVAFIIRNAGHDYEPIDTVTIMGDGAGAAADLTVGPDTGTFPSVPAYFQQRRAFGNTLNNPDTYFLSQPGAYRNFDRRVPPIPSDAITGTPWAVQVNGIQWMVPKPGGLVVLTGLSAWQLSGQGGSSLTPQPIEPGSQQAQPQTFNGISPLLPPININDDIIYLPSKGSFYRSLTYSISSNTYTGDDITLFSSHLFAAFGMVEHAWCEAPYKLMWGTRDDGALLSLTYLKAQEVIGWARHDTFGRWLGVSSVTEPPQAPAAPAAVGGRKVDALYLVAQRLIGTRQAYTIERMNDRTWGSVNEAWCVDCGFRYPQGVPATDLFASSATGLGAITGVTGLVGGSGFSAATTATVFDDIGPGSGREPGSGAVPVLTIVGGVITAVTFPPGNEGAGYINPRIAFYDPSNAGSGAEARCVLDNSAVFTSQFNLFNPGDIGKVIRMGGGVATITAYIDPQRVTANITTPIAAIQPNSGGQVALQLAGTWTMTRPVTSVFVPQLVGATVTGLADGRVIPPTVVPPNGEVVLPGPADAIVVGFGFQAQLQSVYLEVGTPTVQGQRKKIPAVTARVQNSRDFKIGSNQVDGATMSPPQLAPVWRDMVDAPVKSITPFNSLTKPLFTGDVRIPLKGGYGTQGQVAVQQDSPLPLEVLAFIPEVDRGDTPETKARRGASATEDA